MNREKYLPIGSVVALKNANRRLMITGFLAKSKEIENKVYDYVGCFYPIGMLDSKQNKLFNHEQIDQIYYLGYSDGEWKKTEEILKNIELKNKNKTIGGFNDAND